MTDKTDPMFNEAFNIIILGDTQTGKSNIFHKLSNKFNYNWDDTSKGTFLVDYMFTYDLLNNKTPLFLRLCDTGAGQACRTLLSSDIEQANGIIVVYDITSRDSFMHVTDWLEQVKRSGNEGGKIMLIGNKCDLEQKRRVSYEEGRTLGENLGIEFYEVSAKTTENMNKMSQSLWKKLLEAKKGEREERCREDVLETLELSDKRCSCALCDLP